MPLEADPNSPYVRDHVLDGGPMNRLERSDVDPIVAALNHYRRHVRSTDDYPSYEFRQNQLDRIHETPRQVLGPRARGLIVLRVVGGLWQP